MPTISDIENDPQYIRNQNQMKKNIEELTPEQPTVENGPVEQAKGASISAISSTISSGVTAAMGNSSDTSGRELYQALQMTTDKLNTALGEMQKNKFSYAKVEDMCKNITYETGATIGVNFYVYKWYSVNQVIDNQNLITDVGCDNYKDIDIDGIQTTTLFKNGGDIFLKEAKKIDDIKASIAEGLNKTATEYEKLISNVQEISSTLSEIKIPGINLSEDFSIYAEQIKTLKNQLLELTK